MHSSVEIIKLYFADEELGPKAPSLVERSKVMVPWKPSALFADDAMLVAYEFRTGGLLVLNLCTNRGRILELNEEVSTSELIAVTLLMFPLAKTRDHTMPLHILH